MKTPHTPPHAPQPDDSQDDASPDDPQPAPECTAQCHCRECDEKTPVEAYVAVILTLILAVVGPLLIFGFSNTGGACSSPLIGVEKEAAAGPVVEVDAETYAAAYSANEIAAARTYKGTRLHITGTLSRVAMADTGCYSVYLDTGSDLSVECQLEKTEIDKAAALVPGQTVGVTGTGRGTYDSVLLVTRCIVD